MAPPTQAPNARHAGPHRVARVAPGRDSAGLATLEWLLVIAAAGGFAATMAVGLQDVIDDASPADVDADARLIDAGIDAARISDEAIAALIALEISSGDPDQAAVAHGRLDALAQRCETLQTAHPDAVESADWAWRTVPVEVPSQNDADTPVVTEGRWVCQIGHRAS